jgi:hypothetical protein
MNVLHAHIPPHTTVTRENVLPRDPGETGLAEGTYSNRAVFLPGFTSHPYELRAGSGWSSLYAMLQL